MINNVMLRDIIDDRGISITNICNKLGVSRQCFYLKLKNERAFSLVQVKKLCEILSISTDEMNEIFFAQNSD